MIALKVLLKPAISLQSRETILVEENTPATQEIPAVADNLDASLRVVAVQLVENLVIYPLVSPILGPFLHSRPYAKEHCASRT